MRRSATRIRASTMRQPLPGDSAMTGLRSSSTISGHFFGQPGNPQQHFAQGLDVRRSMPAKSLQQLEPANPVEELVRIAIGQRRDPESDVAETSTWIPPRPNADQRSEQRIVGDADHRFDAAGDHRLNQHAFAVGAIDPAVPRRSAVSSSNADRTAACRSRVRRARRRRRSCAAAARLTSFATTGNPRRRGQR